MDALSHILASSSQRVYMNALPVIGSTESPGSTGALLYDMPASNPEYGAWSTRVMFLIRYASVGGSVSPTSWQLGVKFQIEVPHTDGEQYKIPAWADLDADSMAACIDEGVPWGGVQPTGDTGVAPGAGGYGVAFTNADSAGKTVTRTISNFGRGCRIRLYPYAADGTAPYINLTVLAIPMS